MDLRPLIGLLGYPGVGKDETAAILVRVHGYTRVALADALKRQVAVLLKRESDEDLVAYERLLETYKRYPPDHPRGWARMLLQAWATMKRDLEGEDYWLRQIPLHAGTVVSDVRFPNEAEAIRAAGGMLVRVERPGYEGTRHASDVHVASIPVDAVISNHGNLLGLAHEVGSCIDVVRFRAMEAKHTN